MSISYLVQTTAFLLVHFHYIPWRAKCMEYLANLMWLWYVAWMYIMRHDIFWFTLGLVKINIFMWNIICGFADSRFDFYTVSSIRIAFLVNQLATPCSKQRDIATYSGSKSQVLALGKSWNYLTIILKIFLKVPVWRWLYPNKFTQTSYMGTIILFF